MEVSREIILALIPVAVLNYSLAAYCLVRLFRGGKPNYLPKAAWAVIILIVQIFGSVAYLLLGKSNDNSQD